MAFFEIDAGQLYYEAQGSGDPPLLFVHGLACAHEDWRYQIEHFAPSHGVIAIDQRGHGQSKGHGSGFDINRLGADVAALIAHLELPAVVLIGHSMGCRVALECARIAPAGVAGLVLIDGSRVAAPSGDIARRLTRRAMQDSGYDAFFEHLFTEMFTASSNAETRQAIVARARRLPRTVGLELVPQMFAWDSEYATRALSSVKVPLKALQSTHMNAKRERVSIRPGDSTPWLDLVRECVPEADIEIVPGVGHFTMIEAADEVNRHIETMLAKCTADRAS
jgi:pimeloyl-ACP methyl ester carboxylesterase